MKYDSDGNELWTRHTGPLESRGVATSSSGVYIAGTTLGLPGQFLNQYYRDSFIRKYSVNGDEIWTRQFGSPPSGESAWGVAADEAGVYVVGQTGENFTGPGASGSGTAFVRRYDNDGNVVWTRQSGTIVYYCTGSYFSFAAADRTGVYVAGYQPSPICQPEVVVAQLRDDGPTCSADVTSKVTVTRGGFRLNASTKRLVQIAYIRNDSTEMFDGSVSLTVDQLSPHAALFNAAGVTTCSGPPVSPYASAKVGPDNMLRPGETGSVILEFTNPSLQPITFTTRVLAGSVLR